MANSFEMKRITGALSSGLHARKSERDRINFAVILLLLYTTDHLYLHRGAESAEGRTQMSLHLST